MKHLIAILALCLAAGCATIQYLHNADQLSSADIEACRAFKEAAGRNRLQEARALSPILPAGWQPEAIPYRLTEADVVRLLGKPGQCCS